MGNEIQKQEQGIILRSGEDAINYVTLKVREFIQARELCVPANYHIGNALKSAWLILQNTVDKDKNPVLRTCTPASIVNSMLDMVIQGLNPAKKQCYFIAYGQTLTCSPSYFGYEEMVKEMCGADDVDTQVVWGADEFEYEISRGVRKVSCHRQKLENIGKVAKAVYCIIKWGNGSEYTDIMTIEQVKTSWKKSPFYNDDKSKSFHNEFSEEAMKKTCIKRTCKKYINTSSDNHLAVQAMNRHDQIANEEEMDKEMIGNANGELIDFETGEVIEETAQPKLTNQPEPVVMNQPKQPEPELVGAGAGGGNGNSGQSEEGPGF